MARRASRNNSKSVGFTIVELLIVVVVIAILAAITIVSYTGIANNGYDSAVQQDLKNLQTRLELWKVKNGTYPDPTMLVTEPARLEYRATQGSYAVAPQMVSNLIYCYDNSDRTGTYAVAAFSKSGNSYYISASSSGVKTLTTSWNGVLGTENSFCSSLQSNLSNAYRGYAENDTEAGPWRAWTSNGAL